MPNEQQRERRRSQKSAVTTYARSQSSPAHLAGQTRGKGHAFPLHSALNTRVGPSLDTMRVLVARLVWAAAVAAAAVLFVAALLVTIGASPENALAGSVLDVARAIDGPFGGLFTFDGDTVDGVRGAPDEVKIALVNWGLAAAAFLVVGRVVERLIQPSTRH